MRILTGHKVNQANDKLSVAALDEPGPGGANHLYRITGYVGEGNPSHCRAVSEAEAVIEAVLLFQNGAIGEAGVNGITHESLLAVLIDRLDAFQNGPYRCAENNQALWHLRKAREALMLRTARRKTEGTEGTMSLDQADPPPHRSGNPIMRYFAYGHLPEHLQGVSKPVGELAEWADHTLRDGPEKSAGLRKLLEAKDCFVRAAV